MNVEETTELRIWAEQYEDVMKAHTACFNRINAPGIDTEAYKPQLDVLKRAKDETAAAMKGCYLRVAPPGVLAWQKEIAPSGQHLIARLLGVIGDPYIARPHHWEGEGKNRKLMPDEPYVRTVGQLWSYCGHGDPKRQRRQGMGAADAIALGNPRAKTLVRLIAESRMKVMKCPYRRVYDDARLHYAHATHDEECKQCGPKGKPAPIGSPLSKGHQDGRALRRVGKEILKDLWYAAGTELSEATTGPKPILSAPRELVAA